MRIRTVLAAVAAFVAVVPATPASAGTGPSTWCNDSIGHLEVPILTSPVTLGLDISRAPSPDEQAFVLCYSTAAQGQPATGVSGALVVNLRTNTTDQPGIAAIVACYPDHTIGIGPLCYLPVTFGIAPSDIEVGPRDSSICLVEVGPDCAVRVPGLIVRTDADPGRALLTVEVLGVPLPPIAEQCVAFLVSCD